MKYRVKVAIIGAGMAGLSCAHELERHGIEPVIFERNDMVGEMYPHVSAILQIFNRPVRKPLKHLLREYNIDLKPLNPVKHITMISEGTASTVSGDLGTFFRHGVTPESIEKQLEAKVKSKIIFNTHGNYKTLKDEFDYVVVATGTNTPAKELGCWKELLSTVVYGAVILGDFRTDSMTTWFNTRYAKSGYAYLTPFNEKRASLILIVPNIRRNQILDYWNTFTKEENIKNEVVQTFLTEHSSGFVYPHMVGNVFLAGVTGGTVDPFLGFAAIYSIVTGVSAARSIALGLDYEEQIKNYADVNNAVYEYRVVLNSFNNSQFGMLVKGLGAPIIRNLIYNTNINFVKHGSKVLYASRRLKRAFYMSDSSTLLLRNKIRKGK